MPPILVGQRYEVFEEVGRGGMQLVRRAIDTRLGREVAIKAPLGSSAVKRFSESAQLSARIRHPNVASALDYFIDGEATFFVEELIKGMNLQVCLDENFPRVCPDTAAKVLHHLAKGVAASHDSGVIHRDLKPSNVMVSSDLSFSTIKITDFGIAKLAESQIDADLREISKADKSAVSSTLLGAIPFMAPEAIAKSPGQWPGKPMDIWALGAMTYWMLTGKHPFGSQITAVASIIRGEPPPKPDDMVFAGASSGLAQELWKIIQHCMSFKPEDRPDANELAAACANLHYIDSPRVTMLISGKDPRTPVWFGLTADKQTAVHANEFTHGSPKLNSRVSCFCFDGKPNRRAISAIELKAV